MKTGVGTLPVSSPPHLNRVLNLSSSGNSDMDVNDYLRQSEDAVMRHRFQKFGGVVIGDQSASAVMQSSTHRQEMGDNTVITYGASITNADFIMADGKSLEHVGVTPDELLKPMAQDLATNRDPVLARAFDTLGVKVDPARAGAMFPIEWEK